MTFTKLMGNDAKTAPNLYRRRVDLIVDDAVEAMSILLGTG